MKVQNPIIGRSRGSAGGMTFCKVYDKNVARAKAFEVANPKTAAQTTQRNYFKELTALVATFTEDQLRFLFPNKPKAMSRRNALAKQLAEYFTLNAGVKSVDYATIDTIGNASIFDETLEPPTLDTTTIELNVSLLKVAYPELSDNLVCLFLVNVSKKSVQLVMTKLSINNEDIVVQYPEGWTNADTIHALPLITSTKTPLVGFGTMFVVKRPAKANA
jgi:hypothetical protein